MVQEDTYIPKQGVMTAICRTDKDVNENSLPNIVVGSTYGVDYIIIAPSMSMVCLSEFPEMLFRPFSFTFFIGNEPINIIQDYRELKRRSNDIHRGTTLMICNDLSEDRIAQIKQRYDYFRIITRSDMLQ